MAWNCTRDDDLEQSLLKQRLFRKLRDKEIPDLVTLTKIAHSVIREDLERDDPIIG